MLNLKRSKLASTALIGCLMLFNLAFAQADYAASAVDAASNRAYQMAQLSPDAAHYAVLANEKDSKTLLVIDIKSKKVISLLGTESTQKIRKFWWANNERIVVNLELNHAVVDYPLLTGELYAFNIDNTRKFAIAGFTAGDTANYEFLDPYLNKKDEIRVIRNDIKNRRNTVLDLSRPVAYTLDIYKRYRQPTGTNLKDKRLENKYNSPYETGGFVVDNDGELRLAYEIDRDNELKIAKRDYNRDEWVKLDFAAPIDLAKQEGTNPIVGFDGQNLGVYYLAKTKFNTIGLNHLQLSTGQVTELYANEQIDLTAKDLILTSDHDVVGVNLAGTTSPQYFNKTHAEIRRLRGIAKAFEGKRVDVLNYSRAGDYALLDVSSDDSDAGLYLFESKTNSVVPLMSAN